ncbi:MAG: 16S rRNA (adenine1518-N6/adenine1519-N6)-dimethyltransferase [Colwellia polaris]
MTLKEETLQEIADIGLQPVKGQNFLINKAITTALVEAGEIENENVLEIGAGTGNITEKLLESKGEKGTVTAVEKDTVLYEHLQEKFNDEIKNRDLSIVNEDILETDISDYTRAVGNLPFQITSDVLEKLGKNQLQSALIVQDDLADKITADPGETGYGPATVRAQYYFIPVKLQTVPKRNYHPEPEVDTAIIKLYPNKDRHAVEDEEWFFTVVNALFTNKMKKARNAVVDSRHILEEDKDDLKEVRDELPHSETRVVRLNIKQLKEISEALQNKL